MPFTTGNSRPQKKSALRRGAAGPGAGAWPAEPGDFWWFGALATELQRARTGQPGSVAGLDGRYAALPTQRVPVGQRPWAGAALKTHLISFLSVSSQRLLSWPRALGLEWIRKAARRTMATEGTLGG